MIRKDKTIFLFRGQVQAPEKVVIRLVQSGIHFTQAAGQLCIDRVDKEAVISLLNDLGFTLKWRGTHFLVD